MSMYSIKRFDLFLTVPDLLIATHAIKIAPSLPGVSRKVFAVLVLCHVKHLLSLQFRGKMPPPCDPVCKIIDWILAVWHQLNSCLSRLGAPEALMGPKHFFSCPVVPGHSQATVK